MNDNPVRFGTQQFDKLRRERELEPIQNDVNFDNILKSNKCDVVGMNSSDVDMSKINFIMISIDKNDTSFIYFYDSRNSGNCVCVWFHKPESSLKESINSIYDFISENDGMIDILLKTLK